jgi:hypothetical protein
LKEEVLKSYKIATLKEFDQRILKVNFRKLANDFKTNEDELSSIRFYFQTNYPSRTNNEDFAEWIKE